MEKEPKISIIVCNHEDVPPLLEKLEASDYRWMSGRKPTEFDPHTVLTRGPLDSYVIRNTKHKFEATDVLKVRNIRELFEPRRLLL